VPTAEPASPEGTVGRVVAVRSALVLAATVALALAVTLAARAAEPGDPRRIEVPEGGRRTPRRRAPAPVLSERACEIAGSGSNLPIVERLADAYRAQHADDRIVVHRSIGSWGGARAVADGVVHLGLASRPLREDEKAAGLRSLPHVSVAVVLGAHPAVPDTTLSSKTLAALVRGQSLRWSNGTRVVLLEREPGDSSYKVLYSGNALFRAAQRAEHSTEWRVLLHDTEMTDALADTEGAVGLADLGVVSLSGRGLRVLRIDGLSPVAPDYPYVKDLDFVVKGTPRGVAARFLTFALSSVGREIAVRAGYRPRF
jgi:phosphate transport system substrate-binding protein